jgi:DNA-binding protein HU-beta
MNKSELVAELARRTSLTQKDAGAVLDAFFDTVAEGLTKGEKLTVPGWLTVERVERSARTGRNPQTGETFEIAATNAVKLSAGSKLKAAAKS